MYRPDKRLKGEEFSKRQRGGGGLMLWAGVSWRGKTDFLFASNNIGAVAYISMLDEFYQPFVDKY